MAKIVEYSDKEPSAAEFERKRLEILEKIRAIPADQIRGFESRTADASVPGEAKVMWEKTIWAK